MRQVRFNAWHYAETDLWASLVTELFAQLAGPADGEPTREWRSANSHGWPPTPHHRARVAATAAYARQRRDQLRAAVKEPEKLFAALPADQQQDARVVFGEKPEKAYAEVVRTAAAIANTGRVTGRLIRGVRLTALLRPVAVALGLLVTPLVWGLPLLRRFGFDIVQFGRRDGADRAVG